MFIYPELMFIFKSREKKRNKWKVYVFQSKLNRLNLYMKLQKNSFIFQKPSFEIRADFEENFYEKRKECVSMYTNDKSDTRTGKNWL